MEVKKNGTLDEWSVVHSERESDYTERGGVKRKQGEVVALIRDAAAAAGLRESRGPGESH